MRKLHWQIVQDLCLFHFKCAKFRLFCFVKQNRSTLKIGGCMKLSQMTTKSCLRKNKCCRAVSFNWLSSLNRFCRLKWRTLQHAHNGCYSKNNINKTKLRFLPQSQLTYTYKLMEVIANKTNDIVCMYISRLCYDQVLIKTSPLLQKRKNIFHCSCFEAELWLNFSFSCRQSHNKIQIKSGNFCFRHRHHVVIKTIATFHPLQASDVSECMEHNFLTKKEMIFS